MKALLWLKQNWKWLLFPIGLLLWLAGRLSARSPASPRVSSELIEHFERQAQIDAEAAAKEKQAVVIRDELLRGIEQEHTKAVQAVTADAEAKAVALKNDDQALNQFLKQVGKDVRSKS